MTAHIKAQKNEIAKIVIMPGDPLRAKWIAENFLKDTKLVNDVRGMLAYTGKYKDINITVMGHGMGNPSIGIYSHELFSFYDVDVIMRIGSCGAYTKDVKLGDVILVKSCYSESTYADLINIKTNNNNLLPSQMVFDSIKEASFKNNISLVESNAHSSDVFYGIRTPEQQREITKCDVVEMESFALFANATRLNKKAGCILTCSDSLVTHEAMSPEERQSNFKNMVNLALESALIINSKL